MTILKTAIVPLPISADALFAFLADLSRHGVFLEPGAQDFSGDVDHHSYVIEVMGMRMPQEMVVKTRVSGQLVSLVAGERKLFHHELRFEIAAMGEGSTLQLVDEADIPMMMAMMGAEKILQGQLDSALTRIQELAVDGKI